MCFWQGEALPKALKIMLNENRKHNMQKAAACVKGLATFSLCLDRLNPWLACYTSPLVSIPEIPSFSARLPVSLRGRGE